MADDKISLKTKLISTEIGIVKHNDTLYPIHLSALDNFNDMACYLGDPKHVLVTIDWFEMTEKESATFMWHELGHLVQDTVDESLADRYACERVGYKTFESALDLGYLRTVKRLHYRREKAIFRSYIAYRMNTMSNIEKSIDDVFEIVLYDKYKGAKGLDNIEEEWKRMKSESVTKEK